MREADRLLDSAPRTAQAELVANSPQAPGAGAVGGLPGLAIAAAQGAFEETATPNAERELAEATALLEQVADELGPHPAAAQLRTAIARGKQRDLKDAAAELGALVRQLHPALRAEFGLMDIAPLTNWVDNDAADDDATRAAGVGFGRPLLQFVVGVTAFCTIYWFVFLR